MTELLISPNVSIVNNRPAVTSFDVAEHFGKRHHHVIRDIRKVLDEIPDNLRETNFGLTFRTVAGPNNSRRQEEYFVIYQDGFMLLVMGYTGAKAMKIKLAYIIRFNEMAEALRRKVQPQPVLPSVTISPEQQRQLHDIMDAKVKMLAPELSGKARAEAWTRFNRHFRISKYEQLPAERFSEGTEYLINMELKTAGVVAVPDVASVNIPQRRIEVELALRQMGDALRAFYTDMNRVVPPKTYVTYPRAIGNAANLTKAALDAMGSQLEVVQLAAAVSFDVYGVLSDR